MFYEVLGNEPVGAHERAGVTAILSENEKSENVIVTSVITHMEVLPEKLDSKGADDERDYMALFDAVKFAEIELNRNILMRAREIRDYYYQEADENGSGGKMMDLGDAIHLATASIYGVTEFHTRDDNNKGSKVGLLGLYQRRNETKLCEKYPLKILSPKSDQGEFFT
ncbi:type II toxin-antitoxin system VapC family toxin [Rhizobium leguminosarum]|uniref:type II toxin-antitoxin system VapC family toxin n=1 Tax=Rhizobium leguminosarum TaxID=384 RepID=UPI001C95EDEE|nr:PIN domain-containing protein [Rhizobium leguminosarum]MBY5395911.1 type II toxin-antitoxin system VapC family toxin [Rhizobium leguminosarum]